MLSACLLKRAAFDDVASILEPEFFYSECNERIYRAIRELVGSDSRVDPVTVAARLDEAKLLAAIGGKAYLAQIVDATPAVAHIVKHAEIIVTRHRQRAVIEECQRISAEGYGDVGEPDAWISDAEGAVARAGARHEGATSAEHASDILKRAWTGIIERAKGGDAGGIDMGLADLNRLLNRLREGQVMVIGARSHIGKSSLARQIAAYAAGINAPKAQCGVFLWSGEQPREEVAECMMFQAARLSESKMQDKLSMTPSDWQALTAAASEFNKAPMWIEDRAAIGPLALLAEIRKAKRKCLAFAKERDHSGLELKLVVVDYVQLMTAAGLVERNANRERELSVISKKLKEFAMSERVAIIALAQLNKESDKRGKDDQRPRTSDLRESGALEQDADKIVLIYNPSAIERQKAFRDGNKYEAPANETVQLIVGKARGGGTLGTVRSVFFPGCGRFEGWDGREDASEAY